MKHKTIACIDQSVNGLFIYAVPTHFDNDDIEGFLTAEGRHLSNCSWGEFDGDIVDLREYEDPEIERGYAWDSDPNNLGGTGHGDESYSDADPGL